MINAWALSLGAGISLRFRDNWILSFFIFLVQMVHTTKIFLKSFILSCFHECLWFKRDTDQTNMKFSFGSSDSAFPKSGPGCSKDG